MLQARSRQEDTLWTPKPHVHRQVLPLHPPHRTAAILGLCVSGLSLELISQLSQALRGLRGLVFSPRFCFCSWKLDIESRTPCVTSCLDPKLGFEPKATRMSGGIHYAPPFHPFLFFSFRDTILLSCPGWSQKLQSCCLSLLSS